MRAIDADALKEDLRMGKECDIDCPTDWKACHYDRVYAKQDFCEWIDDAPTIEPEPQRKRGQWLDGYKRQTCSLCKGRGVKSWNYCPYCGARMKETNKAD